MTYLVLECPVRPNETKAKFFSYKGFDGDWFAGHRFMTSPSTPIELTWNPEKEHGVRVAYYDASPPVLMTKELLHALRGAGVDNFDEYPVVIRSTTNGPDCHHYAAVNIIGIITAADLERSNVADPGSGMIDMAFDSLAIDERNAAGHLLFRLAESVTTVLIHSTVASILKTQGGFGLTFTRPEDYTDI